VRGDDTGAASRRDQLERIFEPFVQVDRTARTRASRAWGSGLAISRDLARGMGGDLTAASAPEVGSTLHPHPARVTATRGP
jgi:signal transduction histidine kinase